MPTRTAMAVQKMTISLPVALAERLRALVPQRKRSAFIAEALEERLALAEQAQALEETAGIWTDERHPEMATGEDIDRWLAELRGDWKERWARLSGEAGNG